VLTLLSKVWSKTASTLAALAPLVTANPAQLLTTQLTLAVLLTVA
jgi:hypothetical protein